MRCFSGASRFVFNKALALQKANYDDSSKKLSYAALCKELTAWRNGSETPWLSQIHSQILQQSLKDLERAYANFFAKRSDFPRFKRKGQGDSFRFPQGSKLEQGNSRIYLPKIGWLRYRNSREVLGLIKNVTVSSTHRKWFVSIQTERGVEQPHPTATSAIGVDVGIARFATLSDATYIVPLNSFKKQQQRLARYQRQMSRKIKFSSNWKKSKAKVQKIHSDIANARRDFLHKTTTTISKNHALVCIEELQVRNMSKSSKGNREQPGKRVRQKAGLNRAILDQGWGEFRRQLDYKLDWNGGILLAVPPHNTSNTCPCCRYISKDNRKTQATFLCTDCGYANNADVVGAINILERGHRLLACGETALLGRSMKQEPTEVIQAALA
jgi:putative transposase